MAKALGGLYGFDVVRVEVRLKPFDAERDGGIRPFDEELKDEQRDACMQLIEDRLVPLLGVPEWENKWSGSCFEQVLVAEFWPGDLILEGA